MYKSIPDGFRVIMAEEGLKGFTLVSTKSRCIDFCGNQFPQTFYSKIRAKISLFTKHANLGLGPHSVRIWSPGLLQVRFLRDLQGCLQVCCWQRKSRQIPNGWLCSLFRLRRVHRRHRSRPLRSSKTKLIIIRFHFRSRSEFRPLTKEHSPPT